MITLMLSVFIASLLGSLHCAGMCGPFVAFYSGGDGSRGFDKLSSHGVYSSGRFLSYAILGAIAGAVGAVVDIAGSFAGVQSFAAVFAGILMIVWGLLALLRLRGVTALTHKTSPRIRSWISRGFKIASTTPTLMRAASVGLLSALLPCGWLWLFLVAAAGTGGPLRGALVMSAFWAGTVPVLLAIGLGIQVAAAPLRRLAPSLTAVLMVAMGLVAVFARPTSVTAAISVEQPNTIHESWQLIESEETSDHSCCSPGPYPTDLPASTNDME
jgi:sulfite exporter TauE/SafE